MSLIPLFYGQCGNQICESLYSNIANEIHNSKKESDYYTQSLNKWFNISRTNKWEARAVLVDTELKTAPVKKHKHYQFKNVVTKACGGSANNWACGYFEQSKVVVGDIEDCIRRELEKSDILCNFLNIFSVAGGTGAGVGSYVIELLRNEFPNREIVNAVVLPYSNGELVTQSYNTLLTLAKIYSISDSIIVFENDRLHYNCTNSLSIKNVTVNDINNLISRQLLSVYQPMKDIQDLLKKLCENPLFKFLQIRLAPLSKLEDANNWKSLLTSISRQSRFDFQANNIKSKNISTALVCRGLHNPAEIDLKPFKDSNFCKTIHIYHQRRGIFNLENCLSVVTNSNKIVAPLQSILQDAWNLFKYGAYVHHYKKYGVDELYFKTNFEIMEKILGNYKTL